MRVKVYTTRVDNDPTGESTTLLVPTAMAGNSLDIRPMAPGPMSRPSRRKATML